MRYIQHKQADQRRWRLQFGLTLDRTSYTQLPKRQRRKAQTITVS